MDTDILLVVFIGIPGSGKTTLARKLTEHQTFSKEYEVIHVCFDELVSLDEQKEFASNRKLGISNESWRIFLTKLFLIVEECINCIRNHNDNSWPKMLKKITFDPLKKVVFFLDDNFYYKSMRYRFFQLARDKKCGFCQLYLHCDKSLASQRNEVRKSKVLQEVIATMQNRLEVPSPETNMWEFNSLTVLAKAPLINIDLIWEFMKDHFTVCASVLNDRYEEIQEARRICIQNISHRSDILLRNLVSEEVKRLRASNVEGATKVISQIVKIRSHIINSIKKEEIIIPEDIFTNENINEEELLIFLNVHFQNYAKKCI